MTYTQQESSSLPPSNIVSYIESVLPYFSDYWVSYVADNTVVAVVTSNGRNTVYTFTRSGNYSSRWEVSSEVVELVETVTINPLYLYSSDNGLLLNNNRTGQILEFLVLIFCTCYLVGRFMRRFIWKRS